MSALLVPGGMIGPDKATPAAIDSLAAEMLELSAILAGDGPRGDWQADFHHWLREPYYGIEERIDRIEAVARALIFLAALQRRADLR